MSRKRITEKDLKDTYFVPMKRMNEVLDSIGTPYIAKSDYRKVHRIRCDYNILNLKRERSTREYFDERSERYNTYRHKALFVSACYKALYSHDWDRLLYILRRVPRWRFMFLHAFHVRMLTVLLMYHPDSQAVGYFNEYLHMVWGCRSDQDKKAIQKVLLSLPKKLYRSTLLNKLVEAAQKEKKEAFALAQKDVGNASLIS